MPLPDYNNSITNLMASISLGLGGGETGYAPLALLPPERLADRPVCLLLIDGLGEALLRQFPDSHLYRNHIATLTSVFPTTTASAITTFSTAVAPQQHAITGWHMWLRELGSVAAILPFMPRHGGAPYSANGWSPAPLIGASPLYNRLGTPSAILNPGYLVDSDYSRASGGCAQRLSHGSLKDFFHQLVRRLRIGGPQYLFAYWSELDGLAHIHGINSPQVHEHFLAIDQAYGEALQQLRGSGALLLATADHGLIDTAPERILRLEDHPALQHTLALPLCGEPRVAYCYLRPHRTAAFLDYVQQVLADCCTPVASEQALAEGWFGRGTPHPCLEERIGDYLLLMKDNYVLRDRLANERPFQQTGVHGGSSDDEMHVPLLMAEP